MRAIAHPHLPASAYLLALTRARAGRTELWPIELRDPLPSMPIPLRDPDPELLLELGAALAAIYAEAGYDLSLDYTQPPPPPALSVDNAG